MKKIILLLITVIFLTGCNVEYNLTISEDNFNESINLISENYEESEIINLYQKPIEAFNNSPVYSESLEKIPGVEYFNVNKLINEGLYSLNINYDYNFNNFKNSNVLNNSVSVFKFIEKNNEYSLNTGATIKAFDSNDINNLTIKITLDDFYEYVNSNADVINNNEYTWYINKSNYKTNPVTFVFKKNVENNTGNQKPNSNENSNNNNVNNNNNENNSSRNDLLLITLFLLGFIIIITIVIKMSKKINK